MNKQIRKYFKEQELTSIGNEIYKFKSLNVSKTVDNSNLILVTSINPTPTGEGKTTTLIGINDCLNYFNEKSLACLRQPSMGPFFGIKGGATGSGKCALENSTLINCGFTGDFFAIESATNLIQACIENEIYQKSKLNINAKTIIWNRCIDVNDRSLRDIEYLIDSKTKIKSKFNITAASYLMACFCLANSEDDLIDKINSTLIAFDFANKPIYIKDLEISNAIRLILTNAFRPNLVLSKYKNPVIIHGGPFANIAHGCNSIVATQLAMKKAKYVLTEAGFGADLGMEKFLNIKCRKMNVVPKLIVLAITLKSLKHHGGVPLNQLGEINFAKVEKGFSNVEKHIDSIKSFNLNFCIVINKFSNDSNKELVYLKNMILDKGYDCEISTMWQSGPSKNKSIHDLIIRNIKNNDEINFSYDLESSPIEKMRQIAQKIYGANDIIVSKKAINKLDKFSEYIKDYYICFAKNFFSVTSNPKKLGWPKNFKISITDIEINHSSKFIIPIAGTIFLMPGLPKTPNAKTI
ncbi:MAG: formate--tetrahydrofolate ligase [Malacoplasma sp.]